MEAQKLKESMKLFLFLSSIGVIYCQGNAPVASAIKDQGTATSFLKRFGYYNSFSSFSPKQELKASLTRLQEFAGLKVTGNLDVATIKQMNTPRCGMLDPIISVTKTRRKRRFILQGTAWKKTLLTWRLINRGRTLDITTIKVVMNKAFNLWSTRTNIDFAEITKGEPDIYIRFVTFFHNDPYQFDGQGGTLAHAFYPHNNKGLSGDIHFDDAEEYTYKSPYGRNLLWVATHELGHTLGLDHSNTREAVMFPWYTKYKPGFDLNYDDISAIQTLYGSRVTPLKPKPKDVTTELKTTESTTTFTIKPKTKTTTSRKPVTYKTSCPTSTITVRYYNRFFKKEVIITDNEKLYLVNRNGGIYYGPLSARAYLPRFRIRDKISAALDTYVMNGEKTTIFFAAQSYYIYSNFRFISGPHSIKSRSGPLGIAFPSWVNQIDAVLTWQRNKETYFFYDRFYWKYDSKNRRFHSGYPKLIAVGLKGVPNGVDSAYSSVEEKVTYFTKGKNVYKLNDYYVKVDSTYPKHIGEEWLRCGKSTEWQKAGALAIGTIGEVSIIRGKDP